jgi:hypothetical protein
MWSRWLLATVVAVAVIAGIVIAIHRAGPESPTTEAGAEAEVNRVSDLAITEDQAPRSGALPSRTAPAAALVQAITSDVHKRIADEQLTGPLQHVSCHAAGTPSAGRAPYRCSVRSAGITYPFLAVVDARQQRLTWCKVDPPPVAGVGPEIPISASCRA